MLRIVLDSQLRLPLDSRMVRSAQEDVCRRSPPPPRPKNGEKPSKPAAFAVLVFDGRGGRVDIARAIGWLGEQKVLSVIIEAGSKLNWAVLEAQAADKVFFYYAPKILGGTQSLPMAGGVGRRRRSDAIRVRDIQLHPISTDEFAVEGWIERDW